MNIAIKTSFLKKICALSSSLLFTAAVIFLLNSPANYSIMTHTTCRVIYPPVYFWLSCTIYIFVSHRLFLNGTMALLEYAKKCIALLFFLHLYLLLGGLVAQLFGDQGELSSVYFLYIKLVFLLSTAAVSFIAVRQLSLDGGKRIFAYLIFPQFIIAAFCIFLQNLLSRQAYFSTALSSFMVGGAALNIVKAGSVYDFLKKLFRDDRKIAIFIFMLALAARIAFGVVLVHKTTHGDMGYEGYLYSSDDGMTYDETARRILKDPSVLKRGQVSLWGSWDEFYSIFVAVLYKIFGRNFYAVICVQSVIGALIPVFIFFTGKMLFSRAVGIMAALALSLKGSLMSLSVYMGHEAAWLAILYLSVLMLTRYFKEPQRGSFIFLDVATGIALGFLALFRSMYFYFLPFLWVWEAVFFKGIKIARKIAHLAIIITVSLAIMVAAFRAVNNSIRLINDGKAQGLWATSRLDAPFEHLGNERFSEIGVNYFKDPAGSLKAIAAHPFKFAVLAAKVYPLRIMAYLETFQFGFADPIYMVNPAKMANRFASTLEFYFTLFFLVGIAGCFFIKGIFRSPIFTVLAYHVLFLGVLLAHASPRLKEISSPAIYLIGSFGAHIICRYLISAKRNHPG